MTVLTTIALTAFLLEDDYLVTLHEGLKYFTYYFCAFHGGSAYCNVTVGICEENTVKFLCVACFSGIAEIVYIQELVGLSFKLLTLNFYDSVHLKHYFLQVKTAGRTP